MSRDRNIFYNLTRHENSVTEILCNLLQFSGFRSLFADQLKETLKIDDLEFNYEDIYTQKSLGQYGRPDIFIETDKFILLVEVKIRDSCLSKRQPKAYAKYLQNKEVRKDKLLVLLIPKKYADEKELQKRINDIRHTIKKGINVEIMYWEKLCYRLENSDVPKLNKFVQHFTSQLSKEFGTVSFTEKEVDNVFNGSLARTLEKMSALVDGVKEEVERSYPTKVDNIGFSQYGFDVQTKRRRKDKDIVFFGILRDAWKQGLPFVIAIPSIPLEFDEKVESILSRELGSDFRSKLIEEEGWKHYMISKEYIKHKIKKKDDIASFLIEIAERIDNPSNRSR